MKRLAALALVVIISQSPARAQIPVTDVGAIAQRAQDQVQKYLRWAVTLRDMVESADVRGAIRLAAEEANVISSEHMALYDSMLEGYGLIDPGEGGPSLWLSRYGQRLDRAGTANFMRPEELAQRYTMFTPPRPRPRAGLGKTEGMETRAEADFRYQWELTESTMAQVGHMWAQLQEHYVEMQQLAVRLEELEAALAAAQTPEQRRDVGLNIDLVKARYDILDGMVTTAQVNMEAALAARQLDQEAKSLAAQGRMNLGLLDAAEAFSRRK